MSSILLEAINENGLSYREIYNSVGNATNNFTKESGNFKYETQFEANIAKGILKEKYSNVYIKPLNMSKEYDLFYSVVYSKPKESKLEGEVEGEHEDEVEESLTESYTLLEKVTDDSAFVKQALVDHPELRPLIRENKWEELWNTIGGRGPAYDKVQGDLYPRDRSKSSSLWGPSAIGKFIRVFAEAGIDYKIKEIPEYCFINSDITSFKIPDGTEKIGLSAFYNCTKLESIEIPDSIESINVSAFFNCINLRDVKLPSHLSIIGAKAFCGCNSFSEVIIPESCTSIMDGAFSHCISLQRVVIPKTCTHIGNEAFYGCRKIESITLPDRKYKYMEYMKKIGIGSIPKQNIKISESLPVEEEKEYKDFEFQPDKNPAGTPLGNGTGFGEGLIEKIVKKDDGYYVQSEKGKNLGGPYSKEDAEKRLKQVEYFKNKSLNESDVNNTFDAELVKDEIRNQLTAALKKKYKNPIIDFDDEYDDGSKFRVNVEIYDKWNFLAGKYFAVNYNDPYFDLVGDVSNFVNKIVYQIKHPAYVVENLNEAYEYLLDPKFEEFVIAKGLDVDDVIENYSDEELDALGAEFYASKNSSPKPSFHDYMETEFGDDDRWEENPDVEDYYRNKYNIEIGEAVEEVDPEDKEVFCPYCYDQLEFVGYQGNIEEYKCADCNEYYYIDPENPDKLLTADEFEVLFNEDLITNHKKPLNESRAKTIEESLTESVPSGGHYLINGKVYKLDFDKMYDYANEKGLLSKNGLERVLSKFTDGFSTDDQAIGDFENYLKFNRGVDVDESLNEAKVGTKYKNKRGAILKVEEPDKAGNVQYSFIKDGRIVDTKSSSEASFNKMLKVNGYEPFDESLTEKLYSYTNSNDDEELIKDSYHHFTNDLGITPTVDDILEDIINNYNQDMFSDNTPEESSQSYKDIRAILRRLGLDYLDESLNEDKNETLNKDIWDDNNELRPEVKEKLELIVNKFKDALKEDNVDLDIQDVEIVGSNANYNYTDKSDIDLHIIADLSIYKDKEDLAEIIYNAYRRIFNDKFDPMIRGHEVELYVEPAEDTNNNDIPDEVENVDD